MKVLSAIFLSALSFSLANLGWGETLLCRSQPGGPNFLLVFNSANDKAVILFGSSNEKPEQWSVEYSVGTVSPSGKQTLVGGVDNSETDWSQEADCYSIKHRTLEFSISPSSTTSHDGTAKISTHIVVDPKVSNCKLPDLKPDGPAFLIHCDPY